MGTMVVYQSILEPHEPQEILTYNPTVFRDSIYIQEAYCSNPDCNCNEAYLAFHRLDSEENPVNELFRFRLNLKTKEYTDFEVKDERVPARSILLDFMKHIDEFIGDLTKHYEGVKTYYRTYIPEDRMPQLYRQYERQAYVDYHELFSGELLHDEGTLIIDHYRLDEEEEPTAMLQLTNQEDGTSKVIVNLKRKTAERVSGRMNSTFVEKIMNGPIYTRLNEHCAQMKEVGRKVQKASLRFKKVGRNEPCPCGSGKKYKFCHGR